MTTSTTGSTEQNVKLLCAALCVAFAGCSASSVTPAIRSAASTARRPNAATTTTLHVVVPPHSQPKGLTLLLFASGERPALATIPLRTGGSCVKSDVGVECTASLDNLTPGTHELRAVVKAPSTKPSVTRLFVNVADCAANTLKLALYRRAAKIAVASEDPNVIRRAHGYFGPFGSGTFNVTAVDSGGNTLVGPIGPVLSATSSNQHVHERFSQPNTLSLSLDGSVPFDRLFRSRIVLSAGDARYRFRFEAEFTTWPTVPPSPTPAPCS